MSKDEAREESVFKEIPEYISISKIQALISVFFQMSWWVLFNERPRGGDFLPSRAKWFGPYWYPVGEIALRLHRRKALSNATWSVPKGVLYLAQFPIEGTDATWRDLNSFEKTLLVLFGFQIAATFVFTPPFGWVWIVTIVQLVGAMYLLFAAARIRKLSRNTEC